MLYYAQVFHLALYGKPLFNEQIEAWHYEPVVPEVYNYYKQFKANPIPQPGDFNLDEYDQETQELLDEVSDVYGQYTAPALAQFTHQELPWKNTPLGDEIAHSLLKAYFETQLIK